MDKKTTKKAKSKANVEEKPARKIKVIKPNSEVLLVEAKKTEEPTLAESAQPAEEVKAKTVKAKAEPKKKAVKAASTKKVAETALEESKTKKTAAKKATPKKTTKAADTGEARPKRKYTRKTKIEIVDVELVSDIKPVEYVVAETKPEIADAEAVEPVEAIEEKSPVFKVLGVPKLPMLPSENRARLQMQSPNRIFFYWSVKDNPYEKMHKAFGGRAADYRLTAKLVNLSQNKEEIYPVEGTGSWWFNVDANTRYRAEIGFAAHNRPFVRLMFSNTVETPRSSPSPRYDWTPDFYIPDAKFAQALNVSGYMQDAREIVRTEENSAVSQAANDEAAHKAYTQITGTEAKVSANEIRYVLFALASGVSLESLRGYISPTLYTELEAMTANLGASEILAILHEHFGFNPLEEEYEEVEMSGAVYGASVVNFPKGLRKKRSALPPGAKEQRGPAPISSFVNR